MKHLVFKKNADGTLGEKILSYEGPKDDSSAVRSHIYSKDHAEHFLVPEGADEDCCVLVEVDGQWELQEDAALVIAKAEAIAKASAKATLDWAKSVGADIMEEFTLENMAMGITADDMTGAVLDAMTKVIVAMQTGSLKEAIKAAKAIPAGSKDVKYVTDVRLLAFVNKIETKLGLTLSESL